MATKRWIAKHLNFALNRCKTKEETDEMISSILIRMDLTEPTFEDIWKEIEPKVPSIPEMKGWVKQTTKLVLKALDELSEEEVRIEQEDDGEIDA